jgi:predicted O-methyltransferase YrrM
MPPPPLPAIPRARLARGLRALTARLDPVEPSSQTDQFEVADLYPAGHYYSPIPDQADVRARATELFDRSRPVAGVDLRSAEQQELLAELGPLLADWPYAPGAQNRRYHPDNGFFGHTDGRLWYALIRSRRPRKVVEIGSGWSTALLLDTCEEHDLATEVVAVEPYPERLLSTLTPADHERVTIVQAKAQDLPAAELAALEAGDVLFIDSTHVSKIGSDVNHLFFEVLPLLPPGVLVHVHDIAFPFEYPREWVTEGRAWNEAYLLRALLMQNPRWQIELWPSMLWTQRPEVMKDALGDDCDNDGGSLWLSTRSPSGD